MHVFADSRNPYAITNGLKIHSSEYPTGLAKEKSYPVKNLIDSDLNTAWVFEENKSKVNVKGLLFEFFSETKINCLEIINGYTKSNNLYYNNSRIKSFTLKFSNGEEISLECKNSLDFQSFTFSEKTVEWFMLIVDEEYKGKVSSDLCISELDLKYNMNSLLKNKTKEGVIIYNNGLQYESDKITYYPYKTVFDLAKINPTCSFIDAKISPSFTHAVYVDGCSDKLALIMVDFEKQFIDTLTDDKLNHFYPVAWLDDETILFNKNRRNNDSTSYTFSNKYFEFSLPSRTLKPSSFELESSFQSFWRWSERIYKDLSKAYRKIGTKW